MNLTAIPVVRWFAPDRKGYLEACLVVFLLSVLISLLFLAILPGKLNVNTAGDYIGFYEPVARNIIAGKDLIDPRGRPAVRWPPGYPIIIAGIFSLSRILHIPEMPIIIAFNILCLGLASVLLFIMARQFWKPVYALLPAMGFMSYPIVLWLLKQPSVDLPFLVTFFSSIWLLMLPLIRKDPKWYFFLSSGLLVGISMLIRPVAIGVPFIMAIIVWFFMRQLAATRRFAFIGLIFLGVLVFVGPWEIWMYQKTQRFLLITSGGVPCMWDGLIFGIARKYRAGLALPKDVETLMRYFLERQNDFNSMSSMIIALLGQLREHPAAVFKMFSLKIIRTWYGTDAHHFENIILLIQIPYLATFLWSTKKALQAGAWLRWLAVGIWLFVFDFWLTTIMVTPILRFMIPVIGLLFLLLPAIFLERARSYSLK
jgi:hypothetical protein